MKQHEVKEKYKILIADDEQVVRDVFSRFLSREGYEVIFAGNGKEAWDRIKEDNFDLLLLDLNMPVMSGMEVIAKVNEAKKDLIMIVITGYATLDTAKVAIKQGCYDYITKPFDINEVMRLIERAFDMRRLSETKNRMEEQLRVAEKLASLSLMGAGVAHEVNTVLTSIKLFMEMFYRKPENLKEAKKIKMIIDEVERCEELIQRFLNFTKPSESELSRARINEVILRSITLLKPRLEKENIEIVLSLDEHAPEILCDVHKMEEVFLNIFSNGIEASRAGGRITVTSEGKNKKMIISIQDTGSGISPKDLKEVYNPFFTTKPSGTGLGLSIVHRIIEEHQGIIDIRSQEKQGTLVRIEIPIAAQML
ncbi:MAG: response regulator [Elusimicrobia bacterium]|nr:response regulator [Elusimicrobiota bacterium]